MSRRAALALYEPPDDRGHETTPRDDQLDAAALAKAALERPPLEIPWGFADLDRWVGPLWPGRLYMVGARSGNGKTTFLLNLAERLLQHPDRGMYGSVAFLETEAEPEQMLVRWAAFRLGYSEESVVAGKWTDLPIGAKERVNDCIDDLTGMVERLWLPRAPSPTPAEVEALVRRAHQHAYGVVVLDHVHRVRYAAGQERQDLEALCVRLATLAAELNIVLIAAGQFKREEGVFDGYLPPNLGSFMQSSYIEHNATVCLGLFRPLKKISHEVARDLRMGTGKIRDYVHPNVMAVKCMKHRIRGDSAKDRTVWLAVRNGYLDNYAGGPE